MQESLGSKFKRQLHTLMDAIQRTEVQYVRCIKPNAHKSKDELDCAMVVEQLRCAGVIEVHGTTIGIGVNKQAEVNFFSISILSAAKLMCVEKSTWI